MNEYKNYIRKSIEKGQLISWEELYTGHLENPLESIDENEVLHLRRWHALLFQQTFLDNIPDSTEEIFFHNESFSLIKNAKESSEFLHDLHENDFQVVLSIIALQNNISWNIKNPFVSFYCKIQQINFRVSLTDGSLTDSNKSKAFFRVLNQTPFCLEKYDHSKKLETLILEKKNVLIAGATGSGKTTLINSMLTKTTIDDHLLILEDTKELISPHENVTRLLSTDRETGSLNSLLTHGLRMSPDRIILGEMRSKEVTTFIQAMNTGHRGMLTTIHSNSANDALHRATLLFLLYGDSNLPYELILKLICQSIDYVIYIEDKKIKEIIDVFGSEKHQVFYEEIASSDYVASKAL
jgi:type IV secretory pathway ATPase VirB11/archaellum biosynthesis ATPase